MPRYSVLLPTRNRLDYLKFAIETVFRQDVEDWEIIVSDNLSEDDIEGYCKSLDDPRIRYFRTESFVPVTENWNRAIDQATGDYVIMLGDDDGLMPGYFRRLGELIEQFDEPELVHTNAYLIAYPGAVPDFPEGYLAKWTYSLFEPKEPYLLDPATARSVVDKTFRFVVGFGWNMQFSLVKRSLIDEMKKMGPFYQSNYPDYYATNAMFLKSSSTLICPEPMIAIGITPKSFGSFYFSGNEETGVEMLNHALPEASLDLERVVLPGEDHNTSWLVSVETLKRNLPKESAGTEVAYARYRFLQIWHLYREVYLERAMPTEALAELKRRMKWYEHLLGLGLVGLFGALRRINAAKRRQHLFELHMRIGQYPAGTLQMLTLDREMQSILELYDREAAGEVPHEPR